ncbi:tripartite tricarboxylate transporter substrate binding protein [Roseomonas frigidaquae]|uniref:Tripartite tricarboxylate transporter substrate binding protein n=1 Tax=Falsiroseomonas frigidaquae TaxID=487318 RepID=A0ABX1ETW9_9PROT|nr:tripartite tricarboxylate transporter substrate binding protein [Falsiroseomonas frigidaquae]NKE44086.1 tripartite tricarboxylate transporter substrate binding protein [Falsiroseomonas frigidaquae]
MRLTRRQIPALLLGSAALARPALAQAAWPNKPIRLIVGFAPGGATDIMARLIAARMQVELGQPVVVENRAGASGIIGTEVAARATPDGYTLLMGSITTHAVNVPMYGARLSYDPVRDFAPVTRVSTGYNVLVVHPSVPANSVAELIALAKSRPGALAYGHGGNGTSTHLAGEMFKAQAGIDVLTVPFRSTSPATASLLGNEIQMMFDTSTSALPLARKGSVRLLATCAPQRRPAMPDVPAVAETLPGFQMSTWSGVFAPAGTPPEIVAKIDVATRAAMQDPQTVARFEQLGNEPFYAGPDEFADFVRAEIVNWTRIVRNAGISAE